MCFLEDSYRTFFIQVIQVMVPMKNQCKITVNPLRTTALTDYRKCLIGASPTVFHSIQPPTTIALLTPSMGNLGLLAAELYSMQPQGTLSLSAVKDSTRQGSVENCLRPSPSSSFAH